MDLAGLLGEVAGADGDLLQLPVAVALLDEPGSAQREVPTAIRPMLDAYPHVPPPCLVQGM